MITISKQDRGHCIVINDVPFVLSTEALGALGLWLVYQHNEADPKHLHIEQGTDFNGFIFHHPHYKSVHIGGTGIVLQQKCIPEFVKTLSGYMKKHKLFVWDLPLVSHYGPVEQSWENDDQWEEDTVMLADNKFYTVVNHHEMREDTHFPIALIVQPDDTFLCAVRGTPDKDINGMEWEDLVHVKYTFSDPTPDNRI